MLVDARSPIRVDLRSKTPAYLQIVEQVRGLVAAGTLSSGDQLPTVRRLALEAHINFNTVARAYRVLDEAGVISTQHGRGTYVVARAGGAGARRSRQAALESLARHFLASALNLGCSPEEARLAFDKSLSKWAAADDRAPAARTREGEGRRGDAAREREH